MCFIANGTSLVREFLNTTSLKLYLMQTSRKQISIFTEEEFQSCQAASRVNPTQVLESDSEKRMNATCGPKCLEQFERFNQVGSWAKMFSALLIGMGGWYSKRCKLTWKLKGTKSNRLYFQLVQSTLPTSDKGFGSAPILPTPTMFDYNSARTPEKYEEDKAKYAEKGVNLQMPLKQMAKNGMLPTPNSRDYKDSVGNGRDAPSIGKTRGYSLGQKINSMSGALPKEEAGKTSQLNPQFVEEMMGFPENWTILPFLSGETKV